MGYQDRINVESRVLDESVSHLCHHRANERLREKLIFTKACLCGGKVSYDL